MNEKILTGFEGIVEKAKKVDRPMRVAIAAADAENILRGAFMAQDAGFVTPILIGNEGARSAPCSSASARADATCRSSTPPAATARCSSPLR